MVAPDVEIDDGKG